MVRHAGGSNREILKKPCNLPRTWMARSAAIVSTLELLITSGDQRGHWELSAFEKRSALMTHRQPPVSHLGYSLHCSHLDNNHPEDSKDTRTLRYQRCRMMKCWDIYKKKRQEKESSTTFVCDYHFGYTTLSDCGPLCSVAIWVSVWEMSFWQCIKVEGGSAMGMSETVFPHLLTVSGVVCCERVQ